ncbi:3D domain-containing protein [Dokdonia sinensis]|nr:3D domain-containing protein [Dokdonia sinensis]
MVIVLSFLLLNSCEEAHKENHKTLDTQSKNKVTINVTATAYNSVESQTKNDNIGRAAWGDWLQPGERAIAVSRDLIALGLDHNEKVTIEGLPGTYIVKDKMNKRWKKKIDIYMGLDVQAARQWGKKDLAITFNKKDNPNDKFSVKTQ